MAIHSILWILDDKPGFVAIRKYGINWHFAAYLSKLWLDFDVHCLERPSLKWPILCQVCQV